MTAAALLVGGCAGANPTEWSDGLCGSLAPLAGAGSAPPVNPTDLAATQQSQSSALAAAVDATNRALAGLDQLGRAPVEGGDDLASSVVTTVGAAKATLSEARARLDAASPGDPIGFVSVLEQSQRALAAVPAVIEAARRAVAGNAELSTAAQAVASCQRLGVVPAPSPAPTPAAPAPTPVAPAT